MEGFLECCDGRVLALPTPLEWRMEYGAGVPCDSFFVRCLWDQGMEKSLASADRFTARENGETVFHGVVDEFECRFEETGSTLAVTGRGLAALLLDNEAEAADYQVATAADILRDHVSRYGIETAEVGNLPPVEDFSVASGSSEWQVLYEFARYHGGVQPRFDRQGRLVLAPWGEEKRRVLDDSVAATKLVYREKRYGVLSEVLVRDKTRQATERVVDAGFLAEGGRCRRVITTPGRSSYQTMRYSGQFQLDRSGAERVRAEVTVPILFYAWPGELVRLERTGLGCNGLYRVLETTVEADEHGGRTRMTLGEPDVVI